ncbi:hypothetical protein [Legionella cardiaca]|uniref:Uncharacterized protein n=1 Tax=Legionella cardiaca TaxID=1071983 RepID=A0ABY8AS36_9GAMM|nr:hypothetical protein [Legionella cardiaca]WED43274.1 hypothetical protein PXX05_00415 [Legionella cardiaca]
MKYKLPPLVLFESHADRSTTDFLIKNLDYLKKVGYKTFCFEIEVGQSLEKLIEFQRTIIQQQTKLIAAMDSRHPEYEKLVEQLRTVGYKQQLLLELKDSGLEFRAIDTSVQSQLKTGINSLERNETLAKNTLAAANEVDGGVIVLTGFGHCIYQQMIADFDKEHAKDYLWFHLHNPDYETAVHKKLVTAYQNEGYQKYFPLGVSVIDVSQTADVEQRIKEDISRKCYNYESEEVCTSTASILKILIGSEVSAHLRTDGEHHVDAVVSVEEYTTKHGTNESDFLQDLKITLQKIPYEVHDLSTSFSKSSGNHVIIRDINTKEIAEEVQSLKPLI